MTQSAYVEVQKIDWEEAVTRGIELREAKDKSQWELGDLALKVEKQYGFDALGKFATDIGVNKKTLQQYRRTAAAFPPAKREAVLSHKHHLILAAREDRFIKLAEAADNSWSSPQLTRELMIEAGDPPKEQVPEVQKCSCHNKYYLDCHKDKICPKWLYEKRN